MPGQGKGFQTSSPNEAIYLKSPLLDADPVLRHAFSTRNGGVSRGHNSSLNTAFHTGDHPENVIENRRRFTEELAVDHRQLISGIQVHGTQIEIVSLKESGEGAFPDTARKQCDALVTVDKETYLTAYAADCQLLFISSLSIPLVAIAHAGRQGALDGIAEKVIATIKGRFGIDPSQLLVAMSPAICARCYRVDSKTADQFKSKGFGGSPYIISDQDGSYLLDLGAVNLSRLLNSGVRAENIARNSLCTSCRPDLFFSYRRDKGHTGRMMGILYLKGESGDGAG